MPWEEVKKEKACDGRKLRSDSTQASLNHSIGRRARVFFGHGAFAVAQMKFRMREWGGRRVITRGVLEVEYETRTKRNVRGNGSSTC
jgi:hypothetical protein